MFRALANSTIIEGKAKGCTNLMYNSNCSCVLCAADALNNNNNNNSIETAVNIDITFLNNNPTSSFVYFYYYSITHYKNVLIPFPSILWFDRNFASPVVIELKLRAYAQSETMMNWWWSFIGKIVLQQQQQRYFILWPLTRIASARFVSKARRRRRRRVPADDGQPIESTLLM